ncbi:hypothetical protein NQ317_009711 [Molorchus minor]|uniref:Fibronectin type-III domain-containing protein n=1 Tax=Molorchus minor TaxID=1323400 RepID=A0ABQ9IUF0_9CUCU|nr:hypothetical protein NQ317_009711 [Molorchus minor]
MNRARVFQLRRPNAPLSSDDRFIPVDAEPMATAFRWSFNSTPGISRELTEFTSEAGTSTLTYIPKVAADYGTLQCWGQNSIGPQLVPCTYHIVPAGKPDPPHGCVMTNVTHHSVTVTCKKGFDGGLRQKFVSVINYGETTIANVSAASPDFFIPNLEPSQEYAATIYAVNAKGSSKKCSADNYTYVTRSSFENFNTLNLGLKEQRRSTEPTDTIKGSTGPWLYILLAAGSTLIVAAAVGAIIFAVRRFRVDSPVRHPRIRSPKLDESPLTPHVPPLYTDTISDDNNPDLIPDAPNNEALLDTSLAPYTITARPSSKRNCATQMPVKPYHVTWAPILQSRNCATQTPPPHKESSV